MELRCQRFQNDRQWNRKNNMFYPICFIWREDFSIFSFCPLLLLSSSRLLFSPLLPPFVLSRVCLSTFFYILILVNRISFFPPVLSRTSSLCSLLYLSSTFIATRVFDFSPLKVFLLRVGFPKHGGKIALVGSFSKFIVLR